MEKAPSIAVDKNYLKEIVAYLTEIDPPRNYLNTDSLNNAAQFIERRFTATGLETRRQSYETGGNEYHNVIAGYGENRERIFVVGAHYDVYGDQAGADDNASAIAGLLELSRLLAVNRPELDFSVELAAYSLEEPPYFRTKHMGSYVHAASLKKKEITVIGMISLEMIGYFDDRKGSQKYPLPFFKFFYPKAGDYIAVVGNIGSRDMVRKVRQYMLEGSEIDVQPWISPSIVPGVDLSDHRNYWKMGYKAVMITDTAFYRNPYYHTVLDRPETLDFEKMAEVVKGVYNAIINIG